MTKLPDTPLLISSTLGGPLSIFTCTPLRNALTLGSRDAISSPISLYRKVLQGGLRAGWTGGVAPSIVACPQFFALGPIYHCLNNFARDAQGVAQGRHSTITALFAACGAGLAETWLTFGAQSRNAQMAFNKAMMSSGEKSLENHVPLNRPGQIWGAGAGAMTLRNSLTMASVRALSPVLEARMKEGSGAAFGNFQRAFLCDVMASAITCVVSAPIHQTFNYLVTTPEAKSMCLKQRSDFIVRYLCKQYFVPRLQTSGLRSAPSASASEYSWILSRVAVRDFAMRATYVTTVTVMFVSLERALCAWYRDSASLACQTKGSADSA